MVAGAPAAGGRAPRLRAMSDFPQTFASFLDAFLDMEPIAATAIGDHRFDGRWPDVSDAGHHARLAFIDRWRATFGELDPSSLTADEVIDRDLVLGELEAMRFGETDLREETWDPLVWVYLLGEGLFPLLAREFAPLADRMISIASRLEAMRDVTAAAKETLIGNGPDRPVGRLQAETALEQLPGIDELIDEAVATADALR